MNAAQLPPQNLDAERSVLGGILLESSAFDEVQELVRPEDFYREAHRKVFEAMHALAAKNEPIDRVTVKAALTEQGVFASIGGDDFVDLLDKVVPVTTNVGWYARIVREKGLLRRIREACIASAQEACEQLGQPGDLLDRAEERLSSLRATSGSSRAVGSAREVMKETLARIEANYQRDTPITGLASGLALLDADTAGWQHGELILLAARPSVGKTAAALNWALHAAIRRSVTVAIFEMEMPRVALGERMLASEARVSHQRIRTGQLLESDWPKLAHASGAIASAGIEIDDSSETSAMDLRGKARRIARKAPADKPLGLIVVDYLQLMEGDKRIESREQQISEIARSLKNLAGELKVPILALSQLNRSVEKRTDGIPRLSDLRESGALEQHADTVIFAHRPWVLDKRADPTLAEFIIAKQRNGPIGSIEAEFRGEFMLFLDRSHSAGLRHHAEGRDDGEAS